MNMWTRLFLSLRDKLAGTEDLIEKEQEIKRRYKLCESESQKRTLKRKFKKIRMMRKEKEKKATMILAAIAGALVLSMLGSGVGVGVHVYQVKAAEKEQAEREAAEEQRKKEEEETARIAKENEPVEILLTFTGDCTLGRDESFDYDTSLTGYYYNYGPEYFLKNVRSLFEEDDVTIINMEGTLTESTTREPKEFAFKAPQEFSSILTCSSVEAANLANNHSHDYGDQSYTDTINELEGKGIATFGYDEVAIVEVKGIKVGMFGIYELNEHLGRKEQVKNNIQKLKDQGADIIAGVFHWSNELVTSPDSNQVELGHYAIDEGADVVVGHHPHVVQGVEEYKGKMIAYSLGNFCFGGNTGPRDKDTMIFQQKFILKKGEIVDSESKIIPCSISSEPYYNNYQPIILEGDEAERVLAKIAERNP